MMNSEEKKFDTRNNIHSRKNDGEYISQEAIYILQNIGRVSSGRINLHII